MLRPVLLLLPMLIGAGFAQEKELFEAARAGDLAALKKLAGDKANRNLRGTKGRTALHEAVAACRIDAAKFLVQAGWDALARDDDGAAPLTYALRCPGMNWQMLDVFLSAGRLAKPGGSPNFKSEENAWTLQGAASRGQDNVVSMMLRLGADVNEPSPEGNRALEIACLKGDAAIVRILLEGGANPKLRSPAGATPLHDAALSGSAESIELLVKHGADVNATEAEGGSTPLHHAASFGRVEAVKALVRLGAFVSLKNGDGRTALELAVRNGHEEVARLMSLVSAP